MRYQREHALVIIYALLLPLSNRGLLPRKLEAWHTRLGLELDLKGL